ncbi:hypothetical protein [Cypionkella sinensis]|uniref:Uncharacterized protein n=1 Tax=Cypionkella sinensis TaxID=1756043 RepID=A0ABV7IVH0_9RHOB
MMVDILREADTEQRDPNFAALVNAISELINTKLDEHETAHGTRLQYLLICLDGDMAEMAGEISDYDLVFDAMSELGADWVEAGLIDDDDYDSGTSPVPKVN